MGRLAISGILLTMLLAALEFGLGTGRLAAQSRETLVTEGRQLFADKGCLGCHTVGVAGTPIAPNLRRAADRYSEATLAGWLRDPAAQEPTRHMPDLKLTEHEANALAAYLASLR